MAESNAGARKRGLGMGLSALLGSDEDYELGAEERGPTRRVPIEHLFPSPLQPRKSFDDEELDALADSLRRHGLLQPLLVRESAEDRFEIVAGERRWRAAQRAGLHDLTVLVREISDRDLLEMALIENLQREDLSPFDEAEAFDRLCKEHGYSHEKVAEAIGKSRTHVVNNIRLLALPGEVRKIIENGDLTAGHGRALLSVQDPIVMAKRAVAEQLTVRDLELLARTEHRTPAAPNARPERDPDIVALESDLARQVGLKVQISPKRKGGVISFRYSSSDQLEGLIDRLR